MIKAYFRAAFLGFIAVLLIDAFLVFSFMQPLFGFMISVESSLYVEIIFGSIFGAGIQYANEKIRGRDSETNVYSDLRRVLVLTVLTIIITYVVVFGSYLPVFPLVLYLLYHLTLGAFYSSLPSKNHNDITSSHIFGQFISAPLLGFIVTIVFCFSINVIFLMINPLSSSLLLSGVFGAIAQFLTTFFFMDFTVDLSTQWKISFGLLGVCMTSLYLSTTPYLPLFIFCITPMVYYFFRYSVRDNFIEESAHEGSQQYFTEEHEGSSQSRQQRLSQENLAKIPLGTRQLMNSGEIPQPSDEGYQHKFIKEKNRQESQSDISDISDHSGPYSLDM